MTLEVIFNIFVLITIVPCFWVALSGNIVHAAFNLLITLFGTAGLYAMLGADFIAVVQVLVYIGGILVLILFGVMMTQAADMLPLSVDLPGRLFAVVLTGFVFLALLAAIFTYNWPDSPPLKPPSPTVAELGDLLLGKYLIPFELVSILLLAALVGAVLIVRRSLKGE